MELTERLKQLFTQTAAMMTGSARRIYMASIVQLIGKGGQRQAEAESGWNRVTIRKGQRELDSGLE